MKTRSYLSFLKGASLAGLGLAALSLTCLGLTSCGGGGEEDGTDVGKVAKFLQGRTINLYSAGVLCKIFVDDAPRGSRVLASRVIYGIDIERPCYVTLLSAAPMEGDDVVPSATLTFTGHDVKLGEGENFMAWWGQVGYRSIVLTNPQIILTNGESYAGGCQGHFDATCESFTAKDNNNNQVDTSQKDLPTASGAFQIVQE